MTGCDVVLLPYDAAQYRSRLSAVFVDAACAGIPVIVPDKTWMSRQIENQLGAGVTFHSLTPECIGDAVRRALSQPFLKAAAHTAMARAAQRHSPEAVLATILGRAAVAA
jgi:UDP:flavonoid glycosyltransferase YjiC (YdhE family)